MKRRPFLLRIPIIGLWIDRLRVRAVIRRGQKLNINPFGVYSDTDAYIARLKARISERRGES